MNNILNIIKIFSKVLINIHFLEFTGFLFVTLYIFVSFIRQRIPKDIPIELTEIYFFILVYICILFLYIIYRTLYPKQPHTYVLIILNYLVTPYTYFDGFIKYNKYIYPYYIKLLENVSQAISKWESFERSAFIYILVLLPRIILISIFILDVFYVHKLEVFYYFIWLGIFPLLYVYFKYSLNFAIEGYIQHLESFYDSVNLWEEGNLYSSGSLFQNEGADYDEEDYKDSYVVNFDGSISKYIPEPRSRHNPLAIYHDKIVSIKEYFKIQFEVAFNYDEKNSETHYKYKADPYTTSSYMSEYCINNNITREELEEEHFDELYAEFYRVIEYAVPLYNYLEYDKKRYNFYYDKSTYHYNYMLHMRIFIFMTYLICWSYILIISYPTIPIPFSNTLLLLIHMFQALEEPFTGELLIYF